MAAPAKCFLVSGRPGAGKTTLLTRVLDRLRASDPDLRPRGFLTREVTQGSNVEGFEVVGLGGQKGLLASSKLSRAESLMWPTVGRYKVDVASFESIALPELEVNEEIDFYVIDEVSKMKLHSSSFFPAVLKVLESSIPVLASHRVTKSGLDLPEVALLKNHPGVSTFNLNESNRYAMEDELCDRLVHAMSSRG